MIRALLPHFMWLYSIMHRPVEMTLLLRFTGPPNSASFWMHLFLNNHSWIFRTPNATVLSIKEAIKMKMSLVLSMIFDEKSPPNCGSSKIQSTKAFRCPWSFDFSFCASSILYSEASNLLLKFDAY